MNLDVKVSIITATFKAASTIENTILSVEAQTYSNIEHIIIDGCSNDGTSKIVEYYKSPNRIYIEEPDSGLYDAMNKGINAASGDYIIILNADDKFHPSAIETLIKTAKEYSFSSKYIISASVYFAKDGIRLERTSPKDINDNIYLRMPLRHGTMLISKKAYISVGLYDLKYPISADHELSIRLYEAKYKFITLKDPILIFDRGGVSGNVSQKLIEDRLNILSKYFPNDPLDKLEIIANKALTKELIVSLDKSSISKKLCQALMDYRNSVINQSTILGNTYTDRCISLLNSNNKCATVGIFCSTTSGGAGIGSVRRLKALRSKGYDVKLVAMYSDIKDKDIISIFNKEVFYDKWNIYSKNAVAPLKSIPSFKASELFASNYTILDPTILNKLTNKFDILHLHWVNGLIDFRSPSNYKWLNKPIVWTFADFHQFTGGCHYSEGCSEFATGCKSCHLLGEEYSNISYINYMQKKEFFDNCPHLTIVYPSKWLEEKSILSNMYRKDTIHKVIPNPFPIDLFLPSIALKTTKRLLPQHYRNKFVLLAGSEDLSNKRKGLDILFSAIRLIDRNILDRMVLCTFGKSITVETPIDVFNFNQIKEPSKLADIYSTADYFIFPSREDNSPFTVAESLSSGTPVIASNTGNVKQLITSDDIGYIFENSSHVELSQKILHAFQLHTDKKNVNFLSMLKRRNSVKKHNSVDNSINLHLKVYQNCMNFIDNSNAND